MPIDFQPLYTLRGLPVVKVAGAISNDNIGIQFKKGEYDKYSTQTPKKSTLFSGQYLRNRSTLDIGVLGYIGIV